MVTIDDIKILHEFLNKERIDFVLTGTAALDIHGLLPDDYEPEDIDIIVFASVATQEYLVSKFTALQKLTGGRMPDENYTNQCFEFHVGPNNTKVNAILHYIEEDFTPTYIELTFGKLHTLKLHAVDEILKAKFKLQRKKDYKFYKELIKTITNYV